MLKIKNLTRPIFITAAAVLLSACGALPISKQADATPSPAPPTATAAPTPSPAPVPLAHYTVQPPVDFAVYAKPEPIRGVYVSAPRAGGQSYLSDLVDLINNTILNSMVIDVKTDDGFVTYEGIPAADEMGLSLNYISDMPALMDTLYENHIYPIARIVCFKDNGAWEQHPEWYIHNQDGSIWRDSSSLESAWLNPYNKDAWDYVLSVAKSAAEAGFKEIQFDYIRFDTSSRLEDADFGDTGGKSRTEIIAEFVQYAHDQLAPMGVAVAADVYGTVISSDLDASIVGQDYAEMSQYLDYICPMVYPSHYAENSMGIDYPDIHPYETIYNAMELSNERLAEIPEGEHCAVVRPWLQDFTATWIEPHLKYGEAERTAQIKGAHDAGLDGFLLWDPSVDYSPEGLLTEITDDDTTK